MKKSLAILIATFAATSAYGADFDTMDANSDGVISLERPLHNSGFHLGQDFGIPEQSNSGCLDGPVFT